MSHKELTDKELVWPASTTGTPVDKHCLIITGTPVDQVDMFATELRSAFTIRHLFVLFVTITNSKMYKSIFPTPESRILLVGMLAFT